MGYPYDELVPAAVLLDNPGITREEYLKLLNETHPTNFVTYKYDDPWDHYDPECRSMLLRRGLESLVSVLGIDYSKEFKKFQKNSKDENDLVVNSPTLYPKNNKDNPEHQVLIHKNNLLRGVSRVKSLSWSKLDIGSMLYEPMMSEEEGIVIKIYNEEYIEDDKKKEEDGEDYDLLNECPDWDYDVAVRRIEKVYEIEKFKTDKELWKAWPLFNPEKKHDWNQEKGYFPVSLSRKVFLWYNKKGKYYFDDKSFENMPLGFSEGGNFGYTDLILTSEAVKKKAWKLLSYKGLIHLPQFLKDFPDSKEIYEKAVWDGSTSLYAKKNNMSINDFLRFRCTI